MILNDRLEEDEPVYIIEHYGKVGMKWGVRRDPKTGIRPLANTLDKSKFGDLSKANVQRSLARSANRRKNKASRAKDRATHKTTVEKARENINSGKTDAAYKAARQAHAANKVNLGSREARKILNQAKEKSYREYVTADQAKDGKEAAKVILASAAAGLAVYAIGRTITKGSRF